jgi:hypothetical protein
MPNDRKCSMDENELEINILLVYLVQILTQNVVVTVEPVALELSL